MLMPAADLSGIPAGELMGTASVRFSEMLEKAGSFTVYHQDKIEKSSSFRPGEPMDPELLKELKEMGINAIVFQTLNPIETNPDKTGIWPFRRKTWRCAVSMNIDIGDVNRGTILLSKEVAHTITFSVEEGEEKQESPSNAETKKNALREALPAMVEKAAAATIDSLNTQAWMGTILSADGKGIRINAGMDAGLRPGIVFEVFDQGAPIKSFSGDIYHLSGPKVGEIRAFSIEHHYSWAEPIDGTGFKAGQTVRVKK